VVGNTSADASRPQVSLMVAPSKAASSTPASPPTNISTTVEGGAKPFMNTESLSSDAK
jgi:hypothetical protein